MVRPKARQLGVKAYDVAFSVKVDGHFKLYPESVKLGFFKKDFGIFPPNGLWLAR